VKIHQETPGVLILFVPGTLEVKDKSGTTRKRKLEDTQSAFAMLIEKKVHIATWVY
jgi:hypothetical protein